MSSLCRFAVPTFLLASTAACGGGSTGAVSQASFEDRLLDADAQINRVLALSPTAFNAMPDRGTAVFNGSGALLIDPVVGTDIDDIFVLGDARLTANFRAGTMTGDITNMQGATFNPGNGLTTFNVGGRIDIGQRESVIGNDVDDNRTNRANEWYADYDGRITTPEGNFDVEGALTGQFIGTRVDSNLPVTKAIVGFDDSGFAAGGGRELPLVLEVVAEN